MKVKIKLKKFMFIVITFLISCFVLLVGIVLLYSPGKLTQYTDDKGNNITESISEKIFVETGGVKQGMLIRRKDLKNPVLLYVHGGPAFPNYFLIDKYNPGLEDFFTVCYWEQRGGGLSYTPQVELESMNLNQFASDAVEVTNYLRKRFGKEKIYIMAHSGGTTLALLAVSKNPELYHAYIAMAQITKQMDSEKIAYTYMLEQYKNARNQKRANALMKYSVLSSDSEVVSFYKSGLRDMAMHELGIGTMHQMSSVFRDIFIPVWTCKAYTFREKINIWKAKFSFLPKTNLNNEILHTDFTERVQKIDVPVYFLSGKFDLTVNIDMSKRYLEKLQAPQKGFYTFEKSAHSPLFEEPGKVRQIIQQDILRFKTDLADK